MRPRLAAPRMPWVPVFAPLGAGSWQGSPQLHAAWGSTTLHLSRCPSASSLYRRTDST
jgi:hypothetical protein